MIGLRLNWREKQTTIPRFSRPAVEHNDGWVDLDICKAFEYICSHAQTLMFFGNIAWTWAFSSWFSSITYISSSVQDFSTLHSDTPRRITFFSFLRSSSTMLWKEATSHQGGGRIDVWWIVGLAGLVEQSCRRKSELCTPTT